MTAGVPLSAREAQDRALELWERGKTVLSGHFQDRMAQRNVSANDIQHLLETGRIRKMPEFDDTHGNWRYVIEGEDLDGSSLAVVFALDAQAGDLILITARDA